MIEETCKEQNVLYLVKSLHELRDAKKIWCHMIVLTKTNKKLSQNKELISILWHILVYMRLCNTCLKEGKRDGVIFNPGFSRYFLLLTRNIQPFINAFLSQTKAIKDSKLNQIYE